jgi:hypothetical protein
MDKSMIMRTFNKQLSDFVEEIVKLFPNQMDIQTAISSMEVVRGSNPSLLIKMWYQKIYSPYRQEIDSGNYEHFSHITFSQDDQISMIVEKIKTYVEMMSTENRQHTMKYVQILSKLSEKYQSFS